MLARDYVILLVLFSLFAGIGGLVAYDMADSQNGYNVTNMTDSNFDSTYNKIEYTEGIVQQMGNSTTSKEGLGLLGGVELFFGSTVTVIQLVFGSLSTVNSVMGGIMVTFGIPPSIANIIFPAIMSIITIILVFVVISSLTKTKM